MQIVSPTYTAPKAKQKRSKKPKAETPTEYQGRYTHQGRKLGGTTYWVRSKDPGATYAATMAECIRENKKRDTGIRAVIYSENNGRGSGYYASRPTFGAMFDTESAQWAEGLPPSSKESDMADLQRMIQKEKTQNTLTTFTKRIKMLLGTMFDVEETHEEVGYYALRSSNRITLKCNGNTVIIIPKLED